MSNIVPFPAFTPDQDFVIFAKCLRFAFAANDTSLAKQVPVLLAVIGPKLFKLAEDLVAPEKLETKSFDEIVALLNRHLAPTPRVIPARYKFFKSSQEEETISQFMATLRGLAEPCKFGSMLNEMLRDKLVVGVRSENLQKRLLQEGDDATLDRIYEIALSYEAAERDLLSMKKVDYADANVHDVKKLNSACSHCGRHNHLSNKCFFKNAKCHECGKIGHIKPACKNRKTKYAKLQHGSKATGKINVVEASENGKYFITLNVDNKNIQLEFDTGSCHTLMPINLYKKLWNKKISPINLHLKSYSNTKIDVIGKREVFVAEANKTLPLIITEANRIDVLDTLQGSKYFSAIELKSGYWQVEVEEKDKEKTAFSTAHGLYEFNVMPFGLCNAPATFERNMENMLGHFDPNATTYIHTDASNIGLGATLVQKFGDKEKMVETRSGKMQDTSEERLKTEESAKPQPSATIGRDASADPVVLNPNIDIPKYDGTEDPRPWIESLEEIGFLYHWAEYIISRYAAMNMIGSAKTWLDLHKISFTSWEHFKSRLIQDFGSDANKEELKMRLNRMQQWNEPAIRFAEDILVLCNKVDPQMEEENKINWVIGGLKKEYSFALYLNPPKNTNELLRLCKKMDLFENNYQERIEKSKVLYNGPRSLVPTIKSNGRTLRRSEDQTRTPPSPRPPLRGTTRTPPSPRPPLRGLCEALIDTGADLSVVDLRTALFAGREINSLTKTCSGPDGKKLDMVGSIILDLKIDDTELSHEFVVMDAHLRTLILGRDFLKKMNAKIDCKQETIKYNLKSNHDVSNYDLKKIKSTTDTVIPKLSIKLIRASIEAEDGEYVIEENNRMTQTNGLRLARSLLTVTDKKTHIWITNPYPRPLKIMKGQTLAYGSLPAGVNFIENKEKQNENDEIQFQINKNLSFKEQERLKQILAKYTDLFSSRLGRTSLAKHQIHTEDAKPIKHKPYRVNAKERTIIKDQIDEMLEEGIIRQSSSPWSFPVILVKKRDGKYRFCVDYRKLNEVTVKDVYPIPRIDDVMDTLQGSKYFSAIDLKSGYWQVEIEERDKEKTAFTTAHGLYEFNVMPFGLCNAPATFERNMDNVLGNLRWQICLCYLDDVIIYSSDFPTHIKRLEAVLRCFSESNLKLNAKKCRFAFEELEILGHITNQEGIKPAEYNIKAVRDFPQPKKAKEVQSFLGMCSYYRKFIKDFSLIADPLTSLIRKNVQFIWTGKQEEAFQNLKKALMNPPILGHFDPNAATCIHTDASNIGLGATLIQNIGGEEKNFKEENGCLYKKNPNPEGREWLLVVPKKRRKEIMSEYHNHMLNGHLGVARTTYRLKNKYYWPSMVKDVSEFVKTCHLCQSRKGSNQLPSGLLQPIPPANYPFERIGIDFVGPLPSTKRRRKWIIVLTDYYTKYAETKAVPEATVKEVSTFLIEHIFLRHGAPRFLISDRGSQFTSNLMKEVMKMCKVKHCFTTSYHPQTNGLTERLNRTLINMISMYVNTDQKNWDEILPFITHAYNTTIQETTGYSPFFLLFGREPMSLLDDENIPTDSNMDDYDEYIENYLDKIARTRQVVINNTEKTQERMKRNYDKKHNERIYEPGHLVAVWTPVRKIGKCEKLLRKYFGPYRILKKLSNVNYLIEPKDNPGQDPLIVHISRLKPYFERIDEVTHEDATTLFVLIPSTHGHNFVRVDPKYTGHNFVRVDRNYIGHNFGGCNPKYIGHNFVRVDLKYTQGYNFVRVDRNYIGHNLGGCNPKYMGHNFVRVDLKYTGHNFVRNDP
ncbi:hypothetical protein LAZ67_5002141, partial [Cordylochernes scorpioides]